MWRLTLLGVFRLLKARGLGPKPIEDGKIDFLGVTGVEGALGMVIEKKEN